MLRRVRLLASARSPSHARMRRGSLPAIRCRASKASGVRISRRKSARAVAIASGSNAHRVTAASDPGLAVAALMGSDLSAAQAWVAEVLGPLASCTENDERLRETLGVFLRAGSSFKAAAEELHLHSNSVKYRVHRAVERRGRPINGPPRRRSRVAAVSLVRQSCSHQFGLRSVTNATR